MNWELWGFGLLGFLAAPAVYWRWEAKKARRMQFETAVRLDEARRMLARLARGLVESNKRLVDSVVRADELNELAAAYVIVSQLDELRDEPRAPYPAGKKETP